MYREIAGTDEQVRAIPGVRDRRVRATKVQLYVVLKPFSPCDWTILGDPLLGNVFLYWRHCIRL